MKVISRGPLSLSGQTLLISAVTVGSVGTLALDLLLNSVSHTKLAWVLSDCFSPLISQNALDSPPNDLSLPIELFSTSQFLVLQIRSLCNDAEAFLDQLINWCTEVGIGKVVMIGANWDEMQRNENEPECFWLSNFEDTPYADFPRIDFATYKGYLRGSGIIKKMVKSDRVKVTALMVFGRDMPADVDSAVRLAEAVKKSWSIHSELVMPRSWRGILY
jgi:predicted ATP-grasp superfamily ATP-dependent carboligase